MKILIVDDKEENLYLLESLLKGFGYEVVSALNGLDALEKLRCDRFNMIISDILMPVMDGYVLLKKVRENNELKDIPFVFYTATYTDERDEELALKLTVDKYIRKPIEPEEFIDIIEGVIRDAERGKKRPPKPAFKEEKEVLKLYSKRLVKKLEKKMLDLEEEVAERKRAEQSLQQSVREMTFLKTLGQQVTSKLSLDNVVQSALDGIVDLIRLDMVLLFLLDKNKLFIRGEKYTNPKLRHKVTPVHKVGECLCGVAVREKRAIYSININNDPRCTWTECKEAGFISFAALPLRSGDEIIGVLGLGSGIERDFSAQATFLDTVSNQIAVSLQNTILYEQLEDHATKLEQEITERKRAEKQLRASQEYAQNIIDSSLDMIIAVDKRRRITEFNRAAEATFGYEKHEVLGKHVDLLYANVEEGRRVHRQTVESGRLVQEILNKRKNSETFPALLAASTLLDERGEVAGVMGVSKDISEQIQARKELEDALEKAQEGERVKTLFLANMSHEIRTPLNSIMGFTELIESIMEQHIGEEEKSFFEIIRNSGERLMRTVHEILDISQIESGTFEAVRYPLNLNTIITQMQNEFQIRAKEKGLELSYRCGDANITIEGDEYCITQAISNLVDNSIKYTETGKVDLSLLRKNGDILLKIQDTGIGMSQEFQERMFSPFSQESEGYTKDYQGIGLGLALTKGYLDLNGVNIDVQSKKGSGTTITLTFRETKQDRKRSPKAKK